MSPTIVLEDVSVTGKVEPAARKAARKLDYNNRVPTFNVKDRVAKDPVAAKSNKK